ncbi:TPA: glycosyltransferase family 4 protein [Escherichia coli]|nr:MULTISPECIES: glycosyltransferase family 4 protein [Escherichia]EEC8636887.1 glycosyltransferase family 4 protein [Escherichia coli]EET4538542.1 glycosyltransferase family 4 protein [Escherichia coli]EFA6326990.1 glycosyltransferase family 1 protein [Escherichia coli]EFB5223196.1 glycosyltransferase family 4 protein [Escherichia coli]EFC1605047.1 glycosyltransferase family 4 protein [Escherichia coli]
MNKNKYDYIIIYDRIYSYDGEKVTIGGIQTYLVELALLIQEMGKSVLVLQRGYKQFERQYRNVCFLAENKKVDKLVSFRELASKAVELIKSDGVVIWGNDQTSVKIREIKTISIQHGITFDIEGIENRLKRNLIGTPFYSLYRFAQRFNAIRKFERSDYHVCVDYNFINWYRTYKNNKALKQTKVIPNFSNTYEVIPIKDDNRISIVFARRFVERRGVHLFCQAIKCINSEYDNVDFYIAGEGPYKKKMELDLKGLDNVYFCSFRPEDSLFFHADKTIAVVCSIGSEGTSLSLLEAMAAGCAVISTNVGGLTNIVIDNHNGLLCEPNTDSICNAMRMLINDEDKRKRLAINAFYTIKDSFNILKWKDEWKSMLLNIEGKQ